MPLDENIKRWVVLDNQCKTLNQQIKDVREKKNTLNDEILGYFNEKNTKFPTINISDGRLTYSSIKQGNIISYKFLDECFKEFFEDENDAEQLMDLIKTKRTFNIVHSIKRTYLQK